MFLCRYSTIGSLKYAVLALFLGVLVLPALSFAGALQDQEDQIYQRCEKESRPFINCGCAKEHYKVFRAERLEKAKKDVALTMVPGNYCEKNNIPRGSSLKCPAMPDEEAFDATNSYMMYVPPSCTDYPAIEEKWMTECMQKSHMGVTKPNEDYCPCYVSEQIKGLKKYNGQFSSNIHVRLMSDAKRTCMK